jgi:5-methylcytosine-specific restriction endonuclease McrA
MELPSTQYFTDKPCKRGHVVPRYKSSRACVICQREKIARSQKTDPERWKAYSKRHYDKNREVMCERSRVYVEANKEKVRAREAAYRERNKERRRQQAREYRLRDPEHWAVICQRWINKNKDGPRKAAKAYSLRNPEKCRANYASRRCREIQAEGNFTGHDIKALLLSQEFKCAICGCDIHRKPFQVDHIRPLSKGGTNYAGNLQITCPPCNRRKAAKWEPTK